MIGVLALCGCIESAFPVPTGKGNLRALNSAVTAPDLVFLIEERAIGVAQFKDSTLAQPFDDLEYTVNFDYTFTGDLQSTRLTSASFKMVKDNDFLFVFLGSLSDPGILTWENPLRDWESTDTVIEVWFGQLSPDLGEVDFYFTPAGTGPVLGAARATLSYMDRSPIIELPAGDYELYITSKDDPADVLFMSDSVSYGAQVTYLVSTFDADRSITSPVSARRILASGASIELANADSEPTLRVFHTAISTGPVDLYRDADFSSPLISNVDYAETSATVSTPQEVATYTFTDAGNVGSIVLEEDFALFDGHHTTRFLAGATPDLQTLSTIDNFRSVEDSTKLRFIETSVNQSNVDIYLVEAGVDIEEVLPRFFNVTFGVNTGYINIIENDYEVYVTVTATKDILAGPFAFTATDGDIVHFAIVDNVDPNVLDLINYDHLSAAP